MQCPNIQCGVKDEAGQKYSHFRYYFDKEGKLWFVCDECGTRFRPSKTLDGLEKMR